MALSKTKIMLAKESMQLGENGNPEFTSRGVGDQRVVLFNQLVRDQKETVTMLDAAIEEAGDDDLYIQDLVVLTFQTRNCRGGKGERALFYSLYLRLVHQWPDLMLDLLDLIPEFGSWSDLFRLLMFAKSTIISKELYCALMSHCVNVIVSQFKKDTFEIDVSREECRTPCISLLAKWMPREGLAVDKRIHIVKLLATAMGLSPTEYRKKVSALTAQLDIAEVKMCGKRYREINFNSTPSVCLHRFKSAFLNCKSLDDPDRMQARENLLHALKTGVKGGQLFPHELTKKVEKGRKSVEADLVIDAQWKSLVEDVKRQISEFADGDKSINLGNLVPLVDVSASMRGTSMDVAVALGILVGELSSNCFTRSFLTFHSTPEWVNLNECKGLRQKVIKTLNAPWGGSTNFFKAMELILARCVANKLKPEQVPDMIVFSDMQFDQASSDGYVAENLQELFAKQGEIACGMPYNVPTITYWNLRATSGHVSQDEAEGVRMISGYSPSLLKLLLSGQLPKDEFLQVIDKNTGKVETVTVAPTPYSTFRAAVDDEAYDVVRDRINSLKWFTPILKVN